MVDFRLVDQIIVHSTPAQLNGHFQCFLHPAVLWSEEPGVEDVIVDVCGHLKYSWIVSTVFGRARLES